MLEKFGVHVSWLNSGGGKVIAKGKVDNSNSMRMEKRNSEPGWTISSFVQH